MSPSASVITATDCDGGVSVSVTQSPRDANPGGGTGRQKCAPRPSPVTWVNVEHCCVCLYRPVDCSVARKPSDSAPSSLMDAASRTKSASVARSIVATSSFVACMLPSMSMGFKTTLESTTVQ